MSPNCKGFISILYRCGGWGANIHGRADSRRGELPLLIQKGIWLRRGWIQPNPIPTNPRVYPASPPHTGNEATRSRRALGHLSLAALTACPTAADKCASSSASSPSRSPALLLIPFFLVRVRQAAALTAATPAPALIRTAAAPPGQRVHQGSSSPCCLEALPAYYIKNGFNSGGSS
ncbi:hypothetical protein SETIT_9G263800v2 [Setaria italica]|uniref:Uncharacterized protein n=1 Tax=Setaria italica TaxID=4555 RepID=A0A368SKS3_SETIT|nr:hypothetical protein SETIT_9G263800v2 [Setaria italica]